MKIADRGSGLVALLLSLGVIAVLGVIVFSTLGGAARPGSLPTVVTGAASASTKAAPAPAAISAASREACQADTAGLRAAEDESHVVLGHYSTVAELVSHGLLATPSTLHDVPASTLTATGYQVWTLGPAGSPAQCGPGATPVTDGSNGAS